MSPYFVDENVYLVTFFGKNGATPKDDINDMRNEIEQFSKELWQIHSLLLDRTRKNEDN